MKESIERSFELLKAYVEKENFKGWDPYDGLTSRVLQKLPFHSNRWVRLAWIQFFKRSPVNFRKLLLVDKQHNAKGLGLFLSSYCNLYRVNPLPEYKERIFWLAKRIEALASKDYSGACWGYYFDWQARAFFQPKNTPTVVATTYVGYALLDAYDIFGEEQWLTLARSSCDYVLKDLNRTMDADGDFCFSYSPADRSQVFNASLLGSRLLARVYSHTQESELLESATKSVEFCCKHQHQDGSWSYGTLPFHAWIDNFHTGFNLECIHEFQKFTATNRFDGPLRKGLSYYLANFFTEKGESKYYNNALYPIDIHAPAQLVVTLARMGLLEQQSSLVNRVLQWTIKNMQCDDGFFYYQVKRSISSKIPYMRWAQAWMFFALSIYLTQSKSHAKA